MFIYFLLNSTHSAGPLFHVRAYNIVTTQQSTMTMVPTTYRGYNI